ncbi:MAG: hypothetical protein JSW00_03190 [Thermoplasmata archaeon]|nr:MAG: hypothetical protein JSW00_03190 [Thermoplasmata archaeon]
MKFPKDMRQSEFQENLAISRLKQVISDLNKISDIKGAALVEGMNDIIACDLPPSTNYKEDISEILKLLEDGDGYTINRQHEVMFAHRILDYNGYKVLVKKLGDRLTLLVMLQKRGYVSVAMLDIENSIRRIDEIINGYAYEKTLN